MRSIVALTGDQLVPGAYPEWRFGNGETMSIGRWDASDTGARPCLYGTARR